MIIKCMTISIKTIDFETIKSVWETKLWPNRQSPIETHSAMTFIMSRHNHDAIDMNIFNYNPTFLGCFVDDKLVGVNSGHKTYEGEYRSRGLWVDDEYRGMGLAQNLFKVLEFVAANEQCSIMWSIPRLTALPSYQRFGFYKMGYFIKTETADANVYASKIINLSDN